jgi:hypothetical protein
MGTLIGHRERIAVEFQLEEVEPEYKSWIYGTMSLWAGGHRISRHGRHDEVCTLTVALTTFPANLCDAGTRIDPEPMAMPAEKVFATLYDAIYECPDDRTDKEIDELSRRYKRFEVFPHGFEAFDGHRGFLVEDRLVGRLIWRASADEIVREARIGAGEYDRVIDAFLTELEKHPDRRAGIPRPTPSPDSVQRCRSLASRFGLVSFQIKNHHRGRSPTWPNSRST